MWHEAERIRHQPAQWPVSGDDELHPLGCFDEIADPLLLREPAREEHERLVGPLETHAWDRNAVGDEVHVLDAD